ncbi:MAG: type II toxin-antitoxin system Phd/YefM family antitoxin [Thermosynechococcaceae cyanobacterium]
MKTTPNEWQIQEAKNKLSHLVKEADKGIPKFITMHGQSKAVVISAKDYQRLRCPTSKLSSVLMEPLLEESDDLFSRHQDAGREIEL